MTMRLKLYTLLCISFLLIFTACNQDDDPVPAEKVTRTVLAYIMADNSLSGFASIDIDEMMKGMEAVDASLYNLLVYVDDASREGSQSYKFPTLYRLSKDKNGKVVKETVKEYKEQVSTDPAVMQEVLKRAFTEYPAESYGLVLWSHGEGWIPNPLPLAKQASTRWVGEDTTGGTTYLNISDIAAILSEFPRFDFILFDACFGQTVEVAYELRNCTDYVIGSPTEIPGPGAPYESVVPAMFKGTNVGVEIGKAYYEPYEKLYTGVSPSMTWTGGVAISVIDCAALDELASVTKQTIAKNELNVGEIYNYDLRSKYSKNYVGYYDMKQLIERLSSDVTAWTSAADKAIVYWRATPKNYSGMIHAMFPVPQETTCGATHYIPMESAPAAMAAYRSTAWYTAAGLDKIGW